MMEITSHFQMREQYKDGDNVWVEVSPVELWIVDEKSRMMITEKLIFAGVQFNKESNYHTKDFDKTEYKNILWIDIWQEICEQSRGTITLGEQTEETEEFKPRKSRLQKLNPDKTKDS